MASAGDRTREFHRRAVVGGIGRRPGVPRTPASRGPPPVHAWTRCVTTGATRMVGGQPRMGPAPRHPRSPALAWRPAAPPNYSAGLEHHRPRAFIVDGRDAPRRPVIGGVGRSDPFAVARQVARAGGGNALVHACAGGRPREERRTTPPVTGRSNSGGAGWVLARTRRCEAPWVLDRRVPPLSAH